MILSRGMLSNIKLDLKRWLLSVRTVSRAAVCTRSATKRRYTLQIYTKIENYVWFFRGRDLPTVSQFLLSTASFHSLVVCPGYDTVLPMSGPLDSVSAAPALEGSVSTVPVCLKFSGTDSE